MCKIQCLVKVCFQMAIVPPVASHGERREGVSWFIFLENSIENQDLGTKCVCFYWDVIFLGPHS